jgi:23S rRNA pseudouridine1911/1915/1917 synthase
MQHRIVVSEKIPWPARTLRHLVKTAIGTTDKAAEKMIRDGTVQLNGSICTSTHQKVDVGDKIVIEHIPQPVKPKADRSSREAMQILYDDKDIVVVNKPVDLLTVPTPKRESRTLIGEVSKYIDRQRADRGRPNTKSARPSKTGKSRSPRDKTPMYSACCVHRLDRGVSGVLVFAKTLESAELLREQFAERKPERQYIAVVSGRLPSVTGTFRSHLATDENLNQRSVDASDSTAKLAITHYRQHSRFETCSFVTVRLETGRRNQIRVHFAEIGHPILGDPRYESAKANSPVWPHRRLALHAETLGLTHPQTGEKLEFQTPWPEEFRRLHKQLTRRSQ